MVEGATRSHEVLLHTTDVKGGVQRVIIVCGPGVPARLALWMQAPKWGEEEVYSFHVVRMQGETVSGGFTVSLASRRDQAPSGPSPSASPMLAGVSSRA